MILSQPRFCQEKDWGYKILNRYTILYLNSKIFFASVDFIVVSDLVCYKVGPRARSEF